MKIWLIRHGLTRYGEEKRYQGRLDDGLSERGRAELQSAELQSARVQNAELQSAELQSARVQNAEIRSAEFQSAELRNAKFQSTELQNAKFQSAELQNAKFQSAELQNAEFQSTEHHNAEFQSAENKSTELHNAEFQSVENQSTEFKNAENLRAEGGEVRYESLVPDPFPGHVYVSPALRARQTAAILFPGAEQVPVLDLREMDFGAFEGRGWWEMGEDPEYRAWVDGGCLGRCPGGESRASFSGRVCAAFIEILKREREGECEGEREGEREGEHEGEREGEREGECEGEHALEKPPSDGLPLKDIYPEKIPTKSAFAVKGHEPQVVIVAHGGTQMAVLEKWGRPERAYYDWQTPCGCGWLLEAQEDGGLRALRQICFIVND